MAHAMLSRPHQYLGLFQRLKERIDDIVSLRELPPTNEENGMSDLFAGLEAQNDLDLTQLDQELRWLQHQVVESFGKVDEDSHMKLSQRYEEVLLQLAAAQGQSGALRQIKDRFETILLEARTNLDEAHVNILTMSAQAATLLDDAHVANPPPSLSQVLRMPIDDTTLPIEFGVEQRVKNLLDDLNVLTNQMASLREIETQRSETAKQLSDLEAQHQSLSDKARVLVQNQDQLTLVRHILQGTSRIQYVYDQDVLLSLTRLQIIGSIDFSDAQTADELWDNRRRDMKADTPFAALSDAEQRSIREQLLPDSRTYQSQVNAETNSFDMRVAYLRGVQRSCEATPHESSDHLLIMDTINGLQFNDLSLNVEAVRTFFPYDTVLNDSCHQDVMTALLLKLLNEQETHSLRRRVVVIVPCAGTLDMARGKMFLWGDNNADNVDPLHPNSSIDALKQDLVIGQDASIVVRCRLKSEGWIENKNVASNDTSVFAVRSFQHDQTCWNLIAVDVNATTDYDLQQTPSGPAQIAQALGFQRDLDSYLLWARHHFRVSGKGYEQALQLTPQSQARELLFGSGGDNHDPGNNTALPLVVLFPLMDLSKDDSFSLLRCFRKAQWVHDRQVQAGKGRQNEIDDTAMAVLRKTVQQQKAVKDAVTAAQADLNTFWTDKVTLLEQQLERKQKTLETREAELKSATSKLNNAMTQLTTKQTLLVEAQEKALKARKKLKQSRKALEMAEAVHKQTLETMDAEAAEAQSAASIVLSSIEADLDAARNAADDAEGKRVSAVQAQEAAASALLTAQNEANDAKQAQVDAKTAQTAAESDKAAALSAQKSAEAAQKAAEAAQASAEAKQVAAEAKQKAAEAKQATAEANEKAAKASQQASDAELQTAKAAQKTAESAKAHAEVQRTDAETALKQAEAAKATAEAAKATAEAQKATAVRDRVQAEEKVKKAERARANAVAQAVASKAMRKEAEVQQNVAENARNIALLEQKKAETLMTQAIEARDVAIGKQKDAEQAKDAALSAKTKANNAKKAAVDAQIAAEQAKDAAKDAQSAAEKERDAALTAKDFAVTRAETAESAKANAEEAQAVAERAQAAAEKELEALYKTFDSLKKEHQETLFKQTEDAEASAKALKQLEEELEAEAVEQGQQANDRAEELRKLKQAAKEEAERTMAILVNSLTTALETDMTLPSEVLSDKTYGFPGLISVINQYKRTRDNAELLFARLISELNDDSVDNIQLGSELLAAYPAASSVQSSVNERRSRWERAIEKLMEPSYKLMTQVQTWAKSKPNAQWLENAQLHRKAIDLERSLLATELTTATLANRTFTATMLRRQDEMLAQSELLIKLRHELYNKQIALTTTTKSLEAEQKSFAQTQKQWEAAARKAQKTAETKWSARETEWASATLRQQQNDAKSHAAEVEKQEESIKALRLLLETQESDATVAQKAFEETITANQTTISDQQKLIVALQKERDELIKRQAGAINVTSVGPPPPAPPMTPPAAPPIISSVPPPPAPPPPAPFSFEKKPIVIKGTTKVATTAANKKKKITNGANVGTVAASQNTVAPKKPLPVLKPTGDTVQAIKDWNELESFIALQIKEMNESGELIKKSKPEQFELELRDLLSLNILPFQTLMTLHYERKAAGRLSGIKAGIQFNRLNQSLSNILNAIGDDKKGFTVQAEKIIEDNDTEEAQLASTGGIFGAVKQGAASLMKTVVTMAKGVASMASSQFVTKLLAAKNTEELFQTFQKQDNAKMDQLAQSVDDAVEKPLTIAKKQALWTWDDILKTYPNDSRIPVFADNQAAYLHLASILNSLDVQFKDKAKRMLPLWVKQGLRESIEF